VDHAFDISKDKQMFPDFDERVISDLLTSLDLFVEETVWSINPGQHPSSQSSHGLAQGLDRVAALRLRGQDRLHQILSGCQMQAARCQVTDRRCQKRNRSRELDIWGEVRERLQVESRPAALVPGL